MIKRILDKNLQIGVSYKHIVECLGEKFISPIKARKYGVFDYGYKRNRFRPDIEPVYLSEHINGIQCYLVIDHDGKVHPFGLDSMEYLTMWDLVNELEKLNLRDIVIEGTATIIENGKSNFKKINTDKRKRHYNIKNLMFLAYDMFTLEEYNRGKSKKLFNQRFEELKNTFIDKKLNHFRIAKTKKIINSQNFDNVIRVGLDSGWDGFLLIRDVAYDYLRSTDILSVRYKTDELDISGAVVRDFDYLYYENETNNIVENLNESNFDTMIPKMIKVNSLYSLKCNKYNDVQQIVNGFHINERSILGQSVDLIINKRVKIYYISEYAPFKDSMKLKGIIFSKFITE
jgi:hypothetical protein